MATENKRFIHSRRIRLHATNKFLLEISQRRPCAHAPRSHFVRFIFIFIVIAFSLAFCWKLIPLQRHWIVWREN